MNKKQEAQKVVDYFNQWWCTSIVSSCFFIVAAIIVDGIALSILIPHQSTRILWILFCGFFAMIFSLRGTYGGWFAVEHECQRNLNELMGGDSPCSCKNI